LNELLIQWLMRIDSAEQEIMLARPAWQARAACRGQAAELWVGGPRASYEAQRAVCAACPVRRECLDFALADLELVGCWGGTDERERRAMRRGSAA
jgi:WhiB family transcriptional regulator, redox-sensing transcriptional regulator